MANEKRVRNNNVQGTLSSTMSAAGTSMNSAGLANLEAISSTEHAAIIIDPGRTAGAPEIVYVTAHTGSATSATVVRGREGTSARTHSSTEEWVHAPTVLDWRVGALAYAEASTAQLAIGTTQTALTGLTVTLTNMPPNRRIRATVQVDIQQNASNGSPVGWLQLNSTNAKLWVRNTLATSDRELVNGQAILTPSSGTNTIRATLQTSAGNIDAEVAAPNTNWLLVEDIGPVGTV